MTELYYKWIVREEAAELILKNHKKPDFVNGRPTGTELQSFNIS